MPGGSQLNGRIVSLAVDAANLAAGAAGNNDVAEAGVSQGDSVIAIPPAALEAGLVNMGASVPADGTIRLRLFNSTAGAINGASLVWTFIIVSES